MLFWLLLAFGAGAKISNVKWSNGVIRIDAEATHGQKVETGLMKLGAIVGDHVEIGCNAVVSPGRCWGGIQSSTPTRCGEGLPATSWSKTSPNSR